GTVAPQPLAEVFFPSAVPIDMFHDFAAGGGYPFDGVIVPAGGTLTCILQWNDPFGGAADDYDMAIFDADLNLVTFSVDTQNGTQDPIEQVAIVNQTDTDQLANIVIDRFQGEARRLELFCLGAAAMQHGSAAGS